MHGMDSDLIAELSVLKKWLVDNGESSGGCSDGSLLLCLQLVSAPEN